MIAVACKPYEQKPGLNTHGVPARTPIEHRTPQWQYGVAAFTVVADAETAVSIVMLSAMISAVAAADLSIGLPP
jgi:hypothetical protein